MLFYRATAPRSYLRWGKSHILGGYAERIQKPDDIVPAIQRARKMNDDGRAVLLVFITSKEVDCSHRRAFYSAQCPVHGELSMSR